MGRVDLCELSSKPYVKTGFHIARDFRELLPGNQVLCKGSLDVGALCTQTFRRKPSRTGDVLPFRQHPMTRSTQVADKATLMTMILTTFNDALFHFCLSRKMGSFSV